MTLWIGKNSIYKKANSLKEYAEGRMTHRAPNRLKVFKSLKKLKEGLDYTNYEWDGENLRKSNVQPAVEINQIFSQILN
tara:strand:+ start:410 stop:646 length:237 start_codon:yes stop_codon:yes gene_type:complete